MTQVARWPSDISFAVAVGCCAPTAVLAWLAGAAVHPLAGLVVFAGVTAALAAVSSGPAAMGGALLMWATDDGFLVHRFGVLSLDPPSVQALTVIGGVALSSYVAAGPVAALVRWLMRSLSRRGRSGCQGTNRYPMPASVIRWRGCAGSTSSLRRS